MDSEKKYVFTRKYFMKPNTEDIGIVSINEPFVMKDFSKQDWTFIEKVFPGLIGTSRKKTLDMGTTKLHFVQDPHKDLSVELHAKLILLIG